MVGLEHRSRKDLTTPDRQNHDIPRTPLNVGLSALANYPHIVDNFHNVLIDFAVQGSYAPELAGIFEFGIAASHVSNTTHEVIEKGYPSLEIDVFDPADARSCKVTLLGITGARQGDADNDVVFEGFAVPVGKTISTDYGVLLDLNSRTGIAHPQPKFIETMFGDTT